MVDLIVLDTYTPHVYCHSTYIVILTKTFEELQAAGLYDDVTVDEASAGHVPGP